jgi:hypothetical protein
VRCAGVCIAGDVWLGMCMFSVVSPGSGCSFVGWSCLLFCCVYTYIYVFKLFEI